MLLTIRRLPINILCLIMRPIPYYPSPMILLISLHFLKYFRPVVALLYAEKRMWFICVGALDEAGEHCVAPAKYHLANVVQAVLHELRWDSDVPVYRLHNPFANDVQAAKLVEHGYAENLMFITEIDEALVGCQR